MLKSSTGLAVAGVLTAAVLLVSGILVTGNERAPEITFPLLDGRQLPLSSLAGKPVLVTFWATSCIECRKEMPDLIALYKQLSPQGFEMIAVAMPYDPPNRVLELNERMQLPYPVAIDVESRAVNAFGGIAGTPSAFLISPDGRITMRHTGMLDMTLLRDRITGMLAGKNQPLQSSLLPDCGEQQIHHPASAACPG